MATETRTETKLNLQPPEVLQPVAPAEAAGLVPLKEGERDQLEEKVDQFVREGNDDPHVFERLEEAALQLPIGSDGLLAQPYWSGVMDPHWDFDARGVLLGLSGGIDSALSAAVAVDALGAARVHAVMLPSPYTGRDSLEDAAACARLLGIRCDTIPITPATTKTRIPRPITTVPPPHDAKAQRHAAPQPPRRVGQTDGDGGDDGDGHDGVFDPRGFCAPDHTLPMIAPSSSTEAITPPAVGITHVPQLDAPKLPIPPTPHPPHGSSPSTTSSPSASNQTGGGHHPPPPGCTRDAG